MEVPFVSVSLWSIIHSYEKDKVRNSYFLTTGFRLLTEYHSFLLEGLAEVISSNSFRFPSPYGVSFILIIGDSELVIKYWSKFPSPYGVSFILIRRHYFIRL